MIRKLIFLTIKITPRIKKSEFFIKLQKKEEEKNYQKINSKYFIKIKQKNYQNNKKVIKIIRTLIIKPIKKLKTSNYNDKN